MVTSVESDICDRVIEAREKAGLTREEVAARLSLKEGSYGHYERKRSAFTIDYLFRLSRILGKSVAWFLGLETGLTTDEDELLTLYRALPDNLRALALDTIKGFARASRQQE